MFLRFGLITVTSILVLATTTNGGKIVCPKVHITHNVNWSRIMGQWYGINQNSGEVCATMDYKLTGNGTFSRTGYFGTNLTRPFTSDGKIERPGVFKLHLQSGTYKLNGEFGVLGTDYKHYMVYFSCINGVPRTYVETRSKSPNSSVWDDIDEVISGNDLSPKSLSAKTNQC